MKKAIVVGATSGLGRSLALMLAADNYQVGITGRRAALLDELASQAPHSFIAEVCDVTDTGSITSHLDKLVNKLGGLDLLLLCAGTGEVNHELDFSIEKMTIDTNVTGFTAVCDWAFNLFRTRGQGHLAAITSIGGLRGGRESPAYNASKAWQINYLEGLAAKARAEKLPIHVSDIRPGLVDTAMAKGEGLFWVMPVEKAARQIFRAIRKRKKVVYITRRWKIMAYLLRAMPRCIYTRM